MAADPEQPDFGTFEAEARAYTAAKSREGTSQTRLGSTRSSREAFDRPAPARAHERHRDENAADQQKRLAGITDPVRRDQVRDQVAKHYTAWGKALFRAYNQRFDNSQRIYDGKIAARKIDERLIPKNQKTDIRREAIRESVAQSNNRIKEINTAIPLMIDKTINDAVKLSRGRNAPLDKNAQRAKDTAAAYKARAAQATRDRAGRDFER